MTDSIIKFHNVETGEVIERQMNADELAQWETDKAEAAQRKAEAEAQAAQKAALLERLGITQEEVRLLLS